MTDNGAITNQMLLEHIQAGKSELKLEFSRRFDRLERRVDHLEVQMKQGFEDARLDRQGIHDDLDATIRMQAKHDHQIAVLAGGPLPEEF